MSRPDARRNAPVVRRGLAANREPVIRARTRQQSPNRVKPDQRAASSILILEMDEVIACFLTDVVEGLGLRVLGPVATEEEAVTLARRDGPDIVLVEIELGKGSSGISVVRRILEGTPKTAIIYVTDHIDRLAVDDLRNVAVVEKPVDKDELERAIRQARQSATGLTCSPEFGS